MMPRQAIALLLHKDFPQVNFLIRILKNDFDLYIHIDSKADIVLENGTCAKLQAGKWKKML